jgi:hypothetical protein
MGPTSLVASHKQKVDFAPTTSMVERRREIGWGPTDQSDAMLGM